MTWCTVRHTRAQMTDAEFWQHVYQDHVAPQDDDGPDLDDYGPDVPMTGTPCPECGEAGACAWDVEGRPLIHAAKGTSEDDS